MKCRKCKAEVPDNSRFCLMCGARLAVDRKPKARGNGQGTVYKRGSTWTAAITTGYPVSEDGIMHRKTRSKGGFKTKKDAIAYLPMLSIAPAAQKKAITMKELYGKWLPTHRAGKDTMNCYKAAWNYFRPLWTMRVPDVDVDDLQECMDSCPKGKRTKQNMKALCGLLYKFGIPRNITTINLGEYLIVGEGEDGSKDALPLDAVEKLKNAIGSVPFADYIVAQCYLGFRPSELLALDAKDYDRKNKAFIGGAKTDAGRDRTVTISPKIQPIIDRLTANKISGPVFCGADGKTMPIKAYRAAFYAALDAAGIDNPVTIKDGVERHKYTPHSCRHTFATLMKSVNAPDKDKLELIGHTSTEMLRHYQDVDLDALRRITNAL